ncbi:condensation domain-containing protein, partial [Massilia sp.]|uniref:condensation domain-containing protein n=1 Tax=Massilia sp. TaxID=1882437 RepID=UPI00352C94E0
MNLESFLGNCIDVGISFSLEDDELYADSDSDIPADLLSQIRTRKADIIAWIRRASVHEDLKQRRTIESLPRDGNALPLSFAQQRLWFLDQLEGGNAHYNIYAAYEVHGCFDTGVAEQVFSRIVARHEPLRTVFAQQDTSPVQVICENVAFRLQVHDLQALPGETKESAARQLIMTDATTGFNLSTDLMLRASYLQLEAERGILLFNVHHIAADGWSMGILMHEFVQLYETESKGLGDLMPPLVIRYADYAQWQRKWLAGEMLEQQLDYWRGKLADLPAVHSIPLDGQRRAKPAFAGASHQVAIGDAVYQGLVSLARERRTTMFVVLHSALSILLARHGGNGDVVIGTPVANRVQQELHDVVGFFVNTLVLRTDASGNERFLDYLEAVKAINAEAQTNQDVPFDYLVERLNPTRNANYSPLFQILFTMDGAYGTAVPGTGPEDLRFAPLDIETTATKFELMFNAVESQAGMALSITYRTDLFEAASIARMGDHLVT